MNYQTPKTKLLLNAMPIRLPIATVKIGRQPYQDADHLQGLRADHLNTHILKRRGDAVIDVPYAAEAEVLGTPDTISLTDDRGLCKALVLNAILNHVYLLGRAILYFDPVDFLSEEDLLKASVPSGMACPDWLGVRLRYELNVRTHYPDEGQSFQVLVIGVRTATVIDASCAALLEEAINIGGRYVQELRSYHDPRLRPRRSLLGRITGVQGNTLQLDDAREGVSSVDADGVFLEPRRQNLHLCIQAVFGGQANTVVQQLESRIAQVNDGAGRLERIRKVADYFRKNIVEVLPGIKMELDSMLDAATSNMFPLVTIENSPVYVFGPGTKTATWHDKGLDDYGPFDQTTFTPSSPHVVVICQSRHRGQTEQFLRKLLDGVHGVPTSRGREPFGKGLIRKYCLDKCHLEFFEADGDTSDDYRKAIAYSIETATEKRIQWNLAFVQTEERYHQLSGDANPYLVSKAAFLQRGIPSQEVEIETMQVPDFQLVYVLNNIALASYAKLGGIPWLLQANRGIAHELVFGLGSASIGEGRLGNRERIVGITTVFSGDGNYLLENRSKAATMEDYPQALLECLSSTIGNVRQMMNWQERDPVRLVFHAFKPFRNEQIEAVRALVGELSQYEVKYAFLHVVENHPYFVFDEGNAEGVWDSQSKGKKGRFAPRRGISLKISDREMILSLTGARDVKRAADGLPKPILLRLDGQSTFKDMKYLSRQVFHFASHSWRSFFPAPLPITILYSDLIAHFLGNLCRLSKWDSQAMLGPVGRTRWFL